jgi:hypothetical protein
LRRRSTYSGKGDTNLVRRSTQRERVKGDIIGRIMAATAAKLKISKLTDGTRIRIKAERERERGEEKRRKS